MGKKKNNNNSNNNTINRREQVADAIVEEGNTDSLPTDVETMVKDQPIAVEADSQNNNTVSESYGESPTSSPSAPHPASSVVSDERHAINSTVDVSVSKPKYTIVPTPTGESAAQRISGFYRRRENNERTQAEAAEEAAHEERLATLEGPERLVAERSWAFKPSHILMEVAFLNHEKFSRLYIDAEYDSFVFMVSTDAQREKAALVAASRALGAKVESLVLEEQQARAAVRKDAREACGVLLVATETERRGLLAAEREAKRRARFEALPTALRQGDSEAHYDSATLEENTKGTLESTEADN